MTVRLNYKSFGQGRPLIILHGLFGMLDNWQTLARQFAEHYEVYLLDIRNHGKSPHTSSFSYAEAADDIRRFMSERGLSQAHVMGHSMGGKVAMVFCEQCGHMVDKLIIVDIAPKAYDGGHEAIFKAIADVDLDCIESRSEVDIQLSGTIMDKGVRLFLMKNLTRRPEGGYMWKANFEVLRANYPAIMTEVLHGTVIDNDTLFIKGAESHYILEEDVLMINERFSRATMKRVEGAGHWVHAQQPDELFMLVHHFLG